MLGQRIALAGQRIALAGQLAVRLAFLVAGFCIRAHFTRFFRDPTKYLLRPRLLPRKARVTAMPQTRVSFVMHLCVPKTAVGFPRCAARPDDTTLAARPDNTTLASRVIDSAGVALLAILDPLFIILDHLFIPILSVLSVPWVVCIRGPIRPFRCLHCTALHCTALHCVTVHCTALHCTALHCTALRCVALHCTALLCSALHCTALRYAALRCTALR